MQTTYSPPAYPPPHLADPDSQFAPVGVDGLRVHYKMMGSGDPPLLLLHGSFLNLFSWREVMEPLARQHQVVAFDRIAFGLTARPLISHPPGGRAANNPYAPEAQADLTVALLDTLGIEKAVLVGNSTGGTMALLTALRHPTRVQGLVLVGAMAYSGYAVSEVPSWMLRIIPETLVARLVQVVFRRVLNPILRSFYRPDAPPAPATLAHYRAMLMWGPWGAALWQLIRATHHLHLETPLATLNTPTLVVTGEQDRTVPVEQSERLARELPNGQLVVLPGCAHLPHEERPELFVNAVTSFLSVLL